MIELALALAFATPPTGCYPVDGEQIQARHLAAAAPVFSSLPAGIAFGYAPVPGSRRVIPARELIRFAKAHGLALDFQGEICMEWRMTAPTPERMIEAMRRTLSRPDTTIRIVEHSRHPVPPGELSFPRSGLLHGGGSGPQTPVLWKGYVIYGTNRRFPVWARVMLATPATCVVSAEAIKAGEPISETKLRVEPCERSPLDRPVAQTAGEIAGRPARRPIPKGVPLSTEWLGPHRDVVKGDLVQVEVRSGAARLSFEGRAESAGSKGERISVRNLKSGKNFAATVEGKGRARVTVAILERR